MSHSLLFGGSASFRRGNAQLDAVETTKPNLVAAQALVTVFSPPQADLHDRSAALATTTAAASSSASAAPLQRETEAGHAYPRIPFYGLLNTLDITLDVPPGEEVRIGTWSRRADAHLQSIVRKAGVVYYLGTQSALQDPDMRLGHSLTSLGSGVLDGADTSSLVSSATGAQAATATATASAGFSLSYGAYVSALMDGLAQLTCLRESMSAQPQRQHQNPSASAPSSSTRLCPHTLYIRIGGHPRWKDLSVMLAVESGRLVLYASASSRITQQFLSRRARQLSLDLVWVAGATMVEEPRTLQATDINPVLVLWDCIIALPLLPGSLTEDSEAGQQSSDVNGIVSGTYVSILSSLPLAGAEQHRVNIRLVRSASSASSSSSPTAGGASRVVWRLVPGTGACGLAVVLPFLFTQIVSGLVLFISAPTMRGAGFCITCAADARASKSRLSGSSQWWRGAGAPTMRPGAHTVAATAHTETVSRPQGLTYMTTRSAAAVGGGGGGAAPVFAPVLSSSSQSWLGFSRLSSTDWVTDETRRLTDLEEDEECEFNLLGLACYPTRSASADSEMNAPGARKRPRLGEDGEAAGVCDFVDTTHWPHTFSWQVEVTRVMTYSSSDSGEDGGP